MATDPTYPWGSPPPPDRQDQTAPLVRLIWVMVLVNLVCVGALTYLLHRNYSGLAVSQPVAPHGDLAADEKATIDLYNKARPSVVHITTLAQSAIASSLEPSRCPRAPAPASSGTRTATSSPTSTSSRTPTPPR